MENTDTSLIRAHCQGDCRAFAELVRRYGASVLGYLTKLTGSRDKAEDLLQETFKRVHEYAHTIRGDSFRPWLFEIATNLALNGLRRQSRVGFVSLNHQAGCADDESCGCGAAELVDDGFEPSLEAMKAEQRRQVRRAIEMLPERQRATLILAYYQHMTYREVAEAMGCSLGTVKMQMFRALRTLAKTLPEMTGGIE